MKNTKIDGHRAAAPRLNEVNSSKAQRFGVVAPLPIGLSLDTCSESVRSLNQILADSITLRDLYKSIIGKSPGRRSSSCTVAPAL